MTSEQDAPRTITPTEQPAPAAAEAKAADATAKTARKSVKQGTSKTGAAAKTPRKTTAKAGTTKSAAKTAEAPQGAAAQNTPTTGAEKAAKPASPARKTATKAARPPKAASGEAAAPTQTTAATPPQEGQNAGQPASASKKTAKAPAKKTPRAPQAAKTSTSPKASTQGRTTAPAPEQGAPVSSPSPAFSEISQPAPEARGGSSLNDTRGTSPAQEAAPASPAKEQQRQPRHNGGRGRGGNAASARQGSPKGAAKIAAAHEGANVAAAPVAHAPSLPSASLEGTERTMAAEDAGQQNAAAGRKQGRRGRGGRKGKSGTNGTNGTQQSAAAMGAALVEGPFIFTDEEPTGPAMIPAEAQTPRGEAQGQRAEEQAQSRSEDGKGRSRSRRGRGRSKGREDRLPGQEPVETAEAWPAGDMDTFFAPAEAGQDSTDDDYFEGETSQQDGGNGRRKKGPNKKGQPVEADNQGKGSRRKMFVSVLPEEQVEVVLTEEGQVREYYVEMLHQAKTKGNIYKGIIHNIDPNLQAAFVSYGAVKNGFLQIDEVHPEYFNTPHDPSRYHKYPPIQKVLRPGQEVLVQVVKEPTGTKGAFLTTYLSLPGRFLVITPGREQIGVSRKVENEAERARLRELLNGLNPGPGLGVIVRTVSMGADKNSLESDLEYLKETWNEIRTRGTSEDAPCLVYQEFDLATRAVRDYLTDDVVEVWLDDEPAANAVTSLTAKLFPRKKNLVRVHQESMPLFERFNLQRQLDQIQSREVALPSGGRLVIDATEALTAIDINSGRSSGKNNFEDMAYRTNMEAARMIPLQLRLRDIGGQVVADFIEMRDKSHWREVEKALRDGMKVDRARYDVGRISSFGMLEMVRQRLGSSAISVSSEPCPHCHGTGQRRNMEWQCQQALREITRLMRAAKGQEKLVYEADATLAMHLLNGKRQRLSEMEQTYDVDLEIRLK